METRRDILKKRKIQESKRKLKVDKCKKRNSIVDRSIVKLVESLLKEKYFMN